MTCKEVMAELEQLGSDSCKRIFKNHGAPEPLFGVKVGDLKVLQKKIKKDHLLSLQLYNTGNSDAQYLAGLIADETKMTKTDLESWASNATWYMLSEYTVAWIAAESDYGYELALKWINEPLEMKQVAGWSTLANLAAVKPDINLDLDVWKDLLKRVEKEIHGAQNRVRYVMNSFVLATGCFIEPLMESAIQTGEAIGTVTVNMGDTSCKVPYAPDYIKSAAAKGKTGKKKKRARC
jgi:3-methyladenine DNA glycosylase AlkD